MSPRCPIAVSVTLLALLAGGCGSASKDSAEDFKGEPKKIATVIEDLQQAGAKRDEGEICDDLLSQSLIAKIREASKSSCDSAVNDSLRDVDAFELEVVKNGITINGTSATAKVKSEAKGDDRIDTLQLVKEDQRRGGKTTQEWKISALAG